MQWQSRSSGIVPQVFQRSAQGKVLLDPRWLSAPARPSVLAFLVLWFRRKRFKRFRLRRLSKESTWALGLTGKLALSVSDPFGERGVCCAGMADGEARSHDLCRRHLPGNLALVRGQPCDEREIHDLTFFKAGTSQPGKTGIPGEAHNFIS